MASKTGYETFGDQKPKELKIRLPMVANSTAETAVDIDTGLDAGDKLGWTIVGMDWCIRSIASPHGLIQPNVAAANNYHCQLIRGEAPDTPVLYDPGDKDLIYDTGSYNAYLTSVGFQTVKDLWTRYRKPERTQMSTLHLCFATGADDTAISDPANELYAVVYYYLVTAPEKSGHEE